MIRLPGVKRRSARRAPRRLEFDFLEPRLLMTADLDGLTALLVADGHPAGCICPGCGGAGLLPAIQSVEEAAPTGGTTASAAAA